MKQSNKTAFWNNFNWGLLGNVAEARNEYGYEQLAAKCDNILRNAHIMRTVKPSNNSKGK